MPELGQLLTVSMLAVALAMDAFSLGLALGTRQLTLRRMLFVCLLVGAFHVVMPFLGMLIGSVLSHAMKGIATLVGGGVLCFLGAKMIWQEPDETIQLHTLGQMILLTITVSLDSLSAGLSLGLFATDQGLALLLFGLSSALLTAMGISIGRLAGFWLGHYGETFGGILLIVLGMKFIW
ncbi:Putative Mn2+ efflux pump MntP [Seinonella peptonophila]|uniref:Putative Mn2+ efflux pump MntP n=1 Tax=Seinonella peptonophila TaxID=112248 RepID=A0A1M4XUS0_9BACL|nr:manganese efflux pump [Seinonella peptonophila]SHE97337.1 Putative Mn2+ efflux pump MntP [Seinonella peptonophila]